MAEESKGAVIAAMGANFAIAAGKLVAGLLTGSAAMLAEAGHSIADTVNQVFLLIGINRSEALPDEKHPMGYGKEAFFWSFLAAHPDQQDAFADALRLRSAMLSVACIPLMDLSGVTTVAASLAEQHRANFQNRLYALLSHR